MSETSFDSVLIDNPLLKVNTQTLIILVMLALISACFVAWRHRYEYKIKRIVREYVYYGLLHFFLGTIFFRTAFILVAGSYLMGMVILLFRSNKYFYH